MSLLHSLKLPNDIQNLCKKDLETLAAEIRETLIELKDKRGGHFASNMGVVELTIALHAVFNSPKDKFVWDVSHQCYVHKLLTGRLDRIFSIKQKGGLSGFAKITESEHDCFGAGHASTALSAGLGMAHARDILGETNHVISIIGDASLSGGMSYEAINNIDKMKKNFICILNDNDMSISPPVGSMAKYFTTLRTAPVYDIAKRKFERICDKIPRIGVPLRRRIEKLVDRLRNTIIDSKAGVLFEEFGFKYLGPLDGHNISVVMAALRYAKTYDGPIMIHLITRKGKGHDAAEDNPVKYHGVSPKTTHKSSTPAMPSYTQIFGETVSEIARENKRVVGITPAMCEGSGLQQFSKEFPDRYFDVGIAEEHAVTFAAGMAQSGLIPILAIYSTFLQRGYDQVIHDIAIQKLPVIFAIDRAGLVGADGPTHHGVFDISFLLPIPNVILTAPKDGEELKALLKWSVTQDKIISIRYPRGNTPARNTQIPIELGKSEVLFESHPDNLDICLIAAGNMAWPSVDIAESLSQSGQKVAVINLRFIKPLDIHLLGSFVQKSRHVFVLEDGQEIGGAHSYILQQLSKQAININHIHSIAIPDQFADHGEIEELRADFSIALNQLEARIQDVTQTHLL